MEDGFVRVGCATPDIKVCDCKNNTNKIIEIINDACEKGIKLLVFPELCICGATCEDMFFQDTLLSECTNSLFRIAKYTSNKNIVVCIGVPVMREQKLYNCVAVVFDGKIIGIVPKNNMDSYETRYFASADKENSTVTLNRQVIPFGDKLIFSCKTIKNFKFAVEVGADLLSVSPLSASHMINGANIIVNCAALSDNADTLYNRMDTIKEFSKRLFGAYLLANAGDGESTTDLVFGGQNIIAENGVIISKNEPFENSLIYGEVDLQLIENIRRKSQSFRQENNVLYTKVYFDMPAEKTNISREISKQPFIPLGINKEEYLKTVMQIQTAGLKKRISHTNAKQIVVGISGGLDSALALLIAVKAIDKLKRNRHDILAVTMPCFGTSERTYNNAKLLCSTLDVEFRQINIKDEVLLHFKDINQNPDNHDVTFENAQARTRTMVLMDIANQNGGLVVGTGDLSELALGWATYNGDHMSMYGVNASIPKTLIQSLIKYEVSVSENTDFKNVMTDIVNTPISPELLPSNDGELSQKTEDLVGPYELHDFFLYYIIYFGFSPSKIYRLAKIAFKDIYDDEIIKKWLTVFYKRFFAQQFKRSCSPDAPKACCISLSPRGDLRMPSDAVCHIWLDEIDSI